MAIKNAAGQAATMSAEAAAFLRQVPSLKIPSFLIPALTSTSMARRFRRQFQAGEDEIEQSLISRYQLKLEPTVIAGVPVLVVTPPCIRPELEDALAFNVHGGGFMMGTARERTALLMAHELGIRVYSVDYTLAPEARFPVALDQCLAVYTQLVAEHSPTRIVAVSSSSGGSLLLGMLHKGRAQQLPMVAALGLFTPAADISGDGDSGVANSGRDLQTMAMARGFARHYIGEADPRDPLVSPIYGTFDAIFPPTILTTGTRDILASNAIRLYWKLRDAGVPVELRISEGMWHGYNWEPALPEAVRVRRDVTDFLTSHLAPAS